MKGFGNEFGKAFGWFSLGFGLLFFGANTATAQEASGGVSQPPKVLVIQREFVKPGKAGSPHQKTESAFVQAFTAAKWPTHYWAMDSISGLSRTLFFTAYDSFDAWGKDNEAMLKNPTLSEALDHAMVADGELLSAYMSSTFVYREDLSFHAPVNIAQMRYLEITQIQVRQGHSKDWEALAKIYIDGNAKAVPDAHWAVFEDMYGGESGGRYLIMTPMKSLAEIDHRMGARKQFAAAVGEEGMKKAAELSAACVASAESNLFAFDPLMSYPPDAWIKSDPTFWKPDAKPAQ